MKSSKYVPGIQDIFYLTKVFEVSSRFQKMLSFRIVFQSLKWVKFHNQMTTYTIEHIELPAKLLDYFLRSHKSNIKQCFVGILTAQLRVYFTHVSYEFSFWPWEFMNRMNHMNSRSIHKQPTCWWFPYRKACSFVAHVIGLRKNSLTKTLGIQSPYLTARRGGHERRWRANSSRPWLRRTHWDGKTLSAFAHTRAMNNSCVCPASFVYVPWLIHARAMTDSCKCHMTQAHAQRQQILVGICAYMCHDSFMYVLWLIHVCAMTDDDDCFNSLQR